MATTLPSNECSRVNCYWPTSKVVQDIKSTLLMREPFEYIHSLDRAAIAYEAVEVNDTKEKLAWIIGRIMSTSGPGILYTQSRKKTEMYANELQKRGIRVAYYHAKNGAR